MLGLLPLAAVVLGGMACGLDPDVGVAAGGVAPASSREALRIEPELDAGFGTFEIVGQFNFPTEGFMDLRTLEGARLDAGQQILRDGTVVTRGHVASHELPRSALWKEPGSWDWHVVPRKWALQGDVVRAGAELGYAVGAGLEVLLDRPLTLGAVSVSIDALAICRGSGCLGDSLADQRWDLGPLRAILWSELLQPTPLEIRWGPSHRAEKEQQRTVQLVSGELTRVVIPTAEVRVAVEAQSADFPNRSGRYACNQSRIGIQNYSGPLSYHDITSGKVAQELSFVVLDSAQQIVEVTAGGFTVTATPRSDAPARFDVRRLEVDHPIVPMLAPGADGGSTVAARRVPGSFTLRRYSEASRRWVSSDCTYATPSGVDLPSGTYELTVTSAAAPGHADVRTLTLP